VPPSSSVIYLPMSPFTLGEVVLALSNASLSTLEQSRAIEVCKSAFGRKETLPPAAVYSLLRGIAA
jgi:hypothetical protein